MAVAVITGAAGGIGAEFAPDAPEPAFSERNRRTAERQPPTFYLVEESA